MNTEPKAQSILGSTKLSAAKLRNLELKATEINKRKLLKNVCKKAEVDVTPLANKWTVWRECFQSHKTMRDELLRAAETDHLFGVHIAESLEPPHHCTSAPCPS